MNGAMDGVKHQVGQGGDDEERKKPRLPCQKLYIIDDGIACQDILDDEEGNNATLSNISESLDKNDDRMNIDNDTNIVDINALADADDSDTEGECALSC